MNRGRLTTLLAATWSFTALGTAMGTPVAVTDAHRAAQTVTLRDVSVQGDLVLGVVANQSSHIVRDVGLLIRYSWSWNDERRPGEHNPGRATFYTIAGPIPPGTGVPFSYRTSEPLPTRSDGHFTPSVEVMTYTEGVEGTAASR